MYGFQTYASHKMVMYDLETWIECIICVSIAYISTDVQWFFPLSIPTWCTCTNHWCWRASARSVDILCATQCWDPDIHKLGGSHHLEKLKQVPFLKELVVEYTMNPVSFQKCTDDGSMGHWGPNSYSVSDCRTVYRTWYTTCGQDNDQRRQVVSWTRP